MTPAARIAAVIEILSELPSGEIAKSVRVFIPVRKPLSPIKRLERVPR